MLEISLITIALLACVFPIFTVLWVRKYYGEPPFYLLLAMVRSPKKGMNSVYIRMVVLEGFLPLGVLLLASAAGMALAPGLRRIILWLLPILLLVAILTSERCFGIYAHIRNSKRESEYMEKRYVHANDAVLRFPPAKRNLVYIYLESMETTYLSATEGGKLAASRIPELGDIARENISFSQNHALQGFSQIPYVEWTISGMAAQHSGMPVIFPIHISPEALYKDFLPGAFVLGDVLQREGYRQTLLLGSDASFAGRADFYRQHGAFTILDYHSAIEEGVIDPDYHVWWGLEDRILYTYAKKELLRLAAGGEPFHLTMLTVDTHNPNGYTCPLCPTEHALPYENVLSCASRQLQEFLTWMQAQDFYRNTTVILSGDHLSMNHQYFKRQGIRPEERFVYNAFLNAPIQPVREKNRAFCALDMYPSALAALGVSIEGERLGLGTNLFSERPTLIEEDGLAVFCDEIRKGSSFYMRDILHIVP